MLIRQWHNTKHWGKKTVNVYNIDHGLQKSEHNNQNHDRSFDRVKPIKDET